MRTFHKDTLRLIKQTFNRFLALFMIVLIGVSFMMGLLSSSEIMQRSVDAYCDETSMMDFEILSPYGFNDDDLEAIRREEFVSKAVAGRCFDCGMLLGGSFQGTVRVEEFERALNRFELISGRYPENENECLILYREDDPLYAEGTEIVLSLEGEDVLKSIRTDTYLITGVVKTPDYMSKMLGTSMYRNRELDTVIYVPARDLISEYYTNIKLTVNGSAELQSFSDEYSELIREGRYDFESLATVQQDKLKDEIIKGYREEIEKGEKELAEKKAEGEEKLAEAKQKLDDANIQILATESELSSLRSVLRAAESRQKSLEKQYRNDSYSKISKIEKETGRKFSAIYAELVRDYGTYNALKRMKESDDGSIQENIDRLTKENKDRKAEISKLEKRNRELDEKLLDTELTDEQREEISSEIVDNSVRITELNGEIAVNDQLIEELENIKRQMSGGNIDQQIKDLDRKYGGSIEKKFTEYSKLEQEKLIYDALTTEMKVVNSAISNAKSQIRAAERKIESGKKEYEKGLKEYQEAVIEFNIEIEKAESDIRKAYQDLEELPEAGWIILDRESHYSLGMFENNSTQMENIGYVMPILFYMVAALVCSTTMTRLIDEQRSQIGLYRALGFSKVNIVLKYVTYSYLATLFASMIGIVAGNYLFPSVIYNTWRLLYYLPELQIVFPIRNVIICFISFSFLMALVSTIITLKTLREVPSQLMRPKAPKSARKTLLEKIPVIWNRFSFTGKITVRNMFRYKMRFLMTVIGVAGCTALLVLGWGIKDSIKDVVDTQFGKTFNHNFTVTLEDDFELQNIVDTLRSDLENEYVAPYMTYSSKIRSSGNEEKAINVIVIDAREGNDVFHLNETDGTTPLKLRNSGVMISQKFADSLDLKTGDIITMESNSGLKADVKIEGICEMHFMHYLFISEDAYTALFDENVHKKSIAVKNTSGNDISSEIEGYRSFMSLLDYESMKEQFNTMIEALDLIILIIIITAGSLAFVVLINLTQVNISERMRELATLKVLGFRLYEVNAYIFKELFLLSLIGAILGMPLGVLFHRFVMRMLNMEMIQFGLTILPMSYLYAFLLTMAFTVIVLILTIRPIRKIKMVESLKSVE